MAAPALEFDHVHKRFGEMQAIKELSFTCKDGELLVLFGPSGAGKTMTILLAAGLQEATAGTIRIRERVVNQVEPRHRDVAVTFESYALYPHLTVRENIVFPLLSPVRNPRLPTAEIARQVQEVAEVLQIADLLDRAPSQLSGGQRQRVALARALVRTPVLYLLDEPIAHLDAKLRHIIRGELRRFQRERGIATILATPDQLEAIALGDRIVVIREGELQQIGTPEELLTEPANEFVAAALGDPPMSILESAVERVDDDLVVRWGGIPLRLDAATRRRLGVGQARARVRVGVRPWEITALEAPAQGVVPASVQLTEPFGKWSVVTVRVDGNEAKVRVPPQVVYPMGTRIWLDLRPTRTYLFDPDSGRAI